MNEEKRMRLFHAANQFYLNKYQEYPAMSDAEYDALVKEYEAEGRSVKDLVEWDKNERVPNTIAISLNKEQVGDNNLSAALERQVVRWQSDEHYMNLKYDGCAIIGLYNNGKLYQIRSTPDEAFGIIRTKSMWDLFPHEIEDKSVVALQGEALVDYTAYGKKARNKANGLVNSCNMDDEVASEVFIRIYRVYFNDTTEYDFHRSLHVLENLPKITRLRARAGYPDGVEDIIFSAAKMYKIDECPTDDLVPSDEGNFQCDGAVLYSTSGIKGFKFYYTESAIATITHIDWSRKNNGSWSATLGFDNVLLNDKNIGRCASGGVPNLMSMKMGVGAKVRVILSNMTIPKVIEVIEPSEDYQWPLCPCGYQMSERDIFGGVLKCGSGYCEHNHKNWIPEVVNRIPHANEHYTSEEFKEYFFNTFPGCLAQALNLDRWDPNKSLKRPEVVSELWDCIEQDNYDEFYRLMFENFNLTDSVHYLLRINCYTGFMVLKSVFENN